jgi:hypothetical protein
MNTLNFLTILLLVTFSSALRLKQSIFTWEEGDFSYINVDVYSGSDFFIRLPALDESEWSLENIEDKYYETIFPYSFPNDGYRLFEPEEVRRAGYIDYKFATYQPGDTSLLLVNRNRDIELRVFITIR